MQSPKLEFLVKIKSKNLFFLILIFFFVCLYPVCVIGDNIILENDQSQIVSGSFETFKGYNSHGKITLRGVGNDVNLYQFITSLFHPGYYKVYAWWPASKENSEQVVYKINHDNGVTEKYVDQTVLGGQWIELGVYPFFQSDIFIVSIEDIFFNKPVIDALRIEFISYEPPPLTIKTTKFPLGNVAQKYQIFLLASGGKPPYTWIVEDKLPEGLNLFGENGTIAGIPIIAGNNQFLLRVYDQNGNSTEEIVELQILMNKSF